MSGVELGVIFSAIQVCFSLGEAIVTHYQIYKNAEASVDESIIRLESTWSKTSFQLDFLSSIWESLDAGHQKLHDRIVALLVGKLKNALSMIERVTKKSKNPFRGVLKVNKWKYTWLKDELDSTLEDLDSWQRIFDPTWFLILKIAGGQLDQQLSANYGSRDKRSHGVLQTATKLRTALREESGSNKANIFLPSNGLSLARDVDIPLSTVKMVQRLGSQKWLLFETFHQLHHSDPGAFLKDARDIARKLSYCDALEFRLFNCQGVVRNFDGANNHPTSCTFVYRMPEGLHQPRSLRNLLCQGNTEHTLSERFQIAKDLVRAVSSVHNFGFVHKNIRPEIIIMLNDGSLALGTPFLAGFEAFRNAEGRTIRFGDTLWYRNIYRHPNRQGPSPSEDYIMQHDIYSLGVCLLELGLFRSLVQYDTSGTPGAPSTTLGLELSDLKILQPLQIKDHLVSLAKKELPKHMGNRFTSIVITCLTCLDEENIDFGDETEFQDNEGILVNVRYIEKVLLQLNELSV